jgi:isoleucyl-tRNA synthetase
MSCKVPLKTVKFLTDNNEFLSDLEDLERYIYEEINCMSAHYANTSGLVNYKIVGNNAVLGKRFNKDISKAKCALTELTQEDITKFIKKERQTLKINVNGADIELGPESFTIETSFDAGLGPNELGLTQEGITVVIDTTQDEEVLELYTMRLFIVTVQKMRKNTKLKPWNKINIYYETKNPALHTVVNKKKTEIVQELLYPVYAVSCQEEIKEGVITSQDKMILEHSVKITITDATGEFLKS